MATSTAAKPTRRKSPVTTAPAVTSRPKRAPSKAAPGLRSWTDRSGAEPSLTVSWVSMVKWIRSAQAGDQIEYHCGHLAEDRVVASQTYPPELSREIDATADLVWTACHLGLIQLFSKRIGKNRFSYLAIRSLVPVPKPQEARYFPSPRPIYLSPQGAHALAWRGTH